MTPSRLRLGQLLVDARLITPEALADVLEEQQKDGRRLGTLLVERGHISEVQLTQILSHQLSVPWVSLLKIEFSRHLLNLVPREVAERYGVLPIYVRRVRGQGDTLYIATADPTNEEALRACGTHAGLPVRAMIAPPSDVRSAIRAYYGVSSADGERLAAAAASAPPATQPAPVTRAERLERPAPPSERPPPEAPPPAVTPATSPAAAADAADRPAAPPPPAEPPAPPPPGPHQSTLRSAIFDDASPTPPPEAPPTVRESSRPPAPPTPPPAEDDPVIELTGARPARPSPPPEARDSRPVPIPSPRGKTPRMVSLTLLDGTTLTLPARPRRRGDPPRAGEPARPNDAAPVDRPEATDRPSAPPDSSPGVPSSLTARDLVAALRAVAHGADASAVLGDDARWEAMFGALLSLLLKKHIIADWELVEELHKFQKR